MRERNNRRHGEPHSPEVKLIKMLDKIMRNRMSFIRLIGDSNYEEGLQSGADVRQRKQGKLYPRLVIFGVVSTKFFAESAAV